MFNISNWNKLVVENYFIQAAYSLLYVYNLLKRNIA